MYERIVGLKKDYVFLNMWFGELGSVDYRGEKLYEKAMGLRGKK